MRSTEATHTVANHPGTGCAGLDSVGRNIRDNPVTPREVEEKGVAESTVQMHKNMPPLQAVLGN